MKFLKNIIFENNAYLYHKGHLSNKLNDLTENSVLILDEPDIYLHPEWQLLFAELIVFVNKYLNIHFLINTHSPYFLNAIEVYASKYSIV